ncbi:hypothetical protein [Neolewinella antarctica]|uniref:Uncharacterized protein n=1 Tax=Neolewinella antarctica TaxID=442734 RepID=A0ABX0X6L5_9BACT|nr:hypothetical protein [Neolewinella antarctica]NJC24658.1 hypothetical protein [Neolewinella antarctica]
MPLSQYPPAPPPADDDPPEEPPILGSWGRMYATVLVAHVVLIICFYLFSQAYA